MAPAYDVMTLTRVGPGTPMGNLLRRYWIPALMSEQLPEAGGAPVRARLLGENLVAYRTNDGSIGLVEENCPHRGASLAYARNEDCHLSIEPAHSNLQLIFITRKRRDATRLDMTAGQRQLDLIQAGRLSPIFFTRESKVVAFTPKSSAAPSPPLIFQSAL